MRPKRRPPRPQFRRPRQQLPPTRPRRLLPMTRQQLPPTRQLQRPQFNRRFWRPTPMCPTRRPRQDFPPQLRPHPRCRAIKTRSLTIRTAFCLRRRPRQSANPQRLPTSFPLRPPARRFQPRRQRQQRQPNLQLRPRRQRQPNLQRPSKARFKVEPKRQAAIFRSNRLAAT